LVANGFDCANALERRALAACGNEVYNQQNQQDAKNDSESAVKPLSDCHSETPSLPSNTWRSSQEAAQIANLVVILKIEFDNLSGFFRRREELPLLDGILARLHEQGVAADNTGTANLAIRRDDYLNFDFAGDVHALCELGIGRRGLALDLALAIVS